MKYVGILSHFSFTLFPLALFNDSFDEILCLCRRFSRYSQRCSIGLRSGLCGGLWSCLRVLYNTHSRTIRAVCFGLLSCWKTHFSAKYSFRTESFKLFFKISRYFHLCIISSMNTNFPSSPPNFTVGRRFFNSSVVPVFFQTFDSPSWPKIMNLLSSVKITDCQKPKTIPLFNLAKLIRFSMFLGFINGFFRAVRDEYPCLFIVLCIVDLLTDFCCTLATLSDKF